MEYYVYIAKSKRTTWFYVGLTNNLEKRLIQHNAGQTTSTSAYKPFEYIFVQPVSTRVTARDLEKFLKVRYNKEAILDIIKPEWRNW